MSHASRIERLMGERTHPLLVTSLVNIRYLTGFTGSSAHLVVGPESNVFVTDGRYGEIAAGLVSELPATELMVYTSGLNDTLAAAVGPGPNLDVEAEHVSWAFSRTLRDIFDAAVHPTTGLVEAHRRVKDDAEIDALRSAAAAGDAAFSALGGLVEASSDESMLGLALIEAMRGAGGEAADWPPIVAVGANAARPHHRNGHTPIGEGLLLLDYGCVVDGYHSDMTRTVWLGDGVDEEMAGVHASVLASNEAGIAAVRPGVSADAVDEACRAVLRGDGYEEFFIHSTGHGVGLEIHEAPWVRRGSTDTLEPGHVVTVEPGVYMPGHGGVRIEDMVVVTEDGCEVLTHSSKELRRLMISTNDVRPGMALNLDDGLYSVVEYQHTKPGKGKAFVKMKLKSLESGAVLERTFRAGENIGLARIDRREYQYLFRDDMGFHFMDTGTYEQMAVRDDLVADAANYLVEGMIAQLPMFEGNPIGIDLPASVELEVTYAEPGVKGDRVSGATKPVTLRTGLIVQAPLFVGQGDVVKVDTRTGDYITRVS